MKKPFEAPELELIVLKDEKIMSDSTKPTSDEIVDGEIGVSDWDPWA